MGYPLLVVALLFTAQAGFVEQRLSKVSQFYDHTVSLKFFHYTKVAKCSVDVRSPSSLGHYLVELRLLLRHSSWHGGRSSVL